MSTSQQFRSRCQKWILVLLATFVLHVPAAGQEPEKPLSADQQRIQELEGIVARWQQNFRLVQAERETLSSELFRLQQEHQRLVAGRDYDDLTKQIELLKSILSRAEGYQPPDRKLRDKQTALIESALDEVLEEAEFPANPLRDVLDYLATVHRITIRMDRERLEEVGVAVDQEVRLMVEGVTLRSALEMLCEDLAGERLDYVIGNQVLTITTRAAADDTHDTRVYDVRDLEAAGFVASQLEDVISSTVDPASWWTGEVPPDRESERSASPGCAIKSLPGCLIVTQSQRVHRAIVDLLGQLHAQATDVSTPTPTGLSDSSAH